METKTKQNIINILYIFLIFSTVLSFVPSVSAQIIALAATLVTLFAAYFFQAQDREDGLLYNHMTYMIRTIWIGSAFLLLGIMVAGTWVYTKGDHSLLTSIAHGVANGIIPDENQMTAIFHDYMIANKTLLITASLCTIGPAMLYFVYRIANGFSRAYRGYRIANPRSWL